MSSIAPLRTRVLLLALLAWPSPILADTVHLKGGSKLDGRLVAEDAAGIDFKVTGAGQVRVERAKIEWIELSDKAKAQASYEEKRKAAADANALVEAGRWAVFHGLAAESVVAFKAALEKDPQNAAAHEALGHRQHQGKWLDEDGYMAATGHVKVQGRWVTKDDADKLSQGWTWVEGKLVSPDDAKRAKGLVEVDGKWVTKKEAERLEKDRAAKSPKSEGPEPKWGDTPKPPQEPKDDATARKMFGPPWRVTTGERFRLITDCQDSDPQFDAKFVKAMDDFWPRYCELFGVNPPQKKIHNFLVHRDKAAFDEWCKTHAPNGVGAYGTYVATHPLQVATLWHSEHGVRGALYTGRHEGGHLFVDQYLRRHAGIWFEEGIATLFEPDIKFPQYPFRWDTIRAAVFDGKGDISMRDLVEGKNVTSTQGYALGAATHWFFLTAKGGAYRKAYQKFLREGSLDSSKALEKAIGKPIDELDKEYREYVREMDQQRELKPNAKQTGPAPWEPPPPAETGAGAKR